MAEYNSRVNHIQRSHRGKPAGAILKAYKVVNKALDNELKKDEPGRKGSIRDNQELQA